MLTFIVVFLVLFLVVAGMAVGVMMGRKPLAGSCGGVGQALGEKDYVCELCGDDEQKCEELKQTPAQAKSPVETAETALENLSYDASENK